MTVFERICDLLDEQAIPFRTVHHEQTFTSEESAQARGEDVKIGGKAILMKIDTKFVLLVVSAALKIDSAKIKQIFSAKNIRFATRDELQELTGLVPGSVPPFGKPIFSIELYIDTSITENEKIAFNAGSLTDSIIMNTQDYLSIAKGTLLSFSH